MDFECSLFGDNELHGLLYSRVRAHQESRADLTKRNVAGIHVPSPTLTHKSLEDAGTTDRFEPIQAKDFRTAGQHECSGAEDLTDQKKHSQEILPTPASDQIKAEEYTNLLAFLCDSVASDHVRSNPHWHSRKSLQLTSASNHSSSPSSSFSEQQTLAAPTALSSCDPASSGSQLDLHNGRQVSLLEHYTRLKRNRQQQLAVAVQPPMQRPPVLQSCSSPASESFSTACFLPLESPRLANQHSLRTQTAQLQAVGAGASYDAFACQQMNGKPGQDILEHPWVASHLQDLSRCFARGKAKDHMAHIKRLSVLPKSQKIRHKTYSGLDIARQASTGLLQDQQPSTQAVLAKPQIPAFATSTSSESPTICHVKDPHAPVPHTSFIMPAFVLPSVQQPSASSLPIDPQQPPRASSRPIRQAATRRQLKYADFEQLDSHFQLESASRQASASSASKGQALSQSDTQSARQGLDPWLDCFEDSEGEVCDFGCDTPANKRRKQHYPWSLEETVALLQGIEDCGGGKWADIKKGHYKAITNRSAVDLKDKWRNLVRVAILPPGPQPSKGAKRRELPPHILLKVRKLHAVYCKASQKHMQ